MFILPCCWLPPSLLCCIAVSKFWGHSEQSELVCSLFSLTEETWQKDEAENEEPSRIDAASQQGMFILLHRSADSILLEALKCKMGNTVCFFQGFFFSST